MKYKAGDKVRCVKSTMATGVNVGDVYTIKGFSHNSEFGVHVALEEVRSTPTTDVFELVQSKPKFKVGNVVVYSHNLYSTVSFNIGDTFKVIAVLGSGNLFLEPVGGGRRLVGSYTPDQFELVQEAAVLTPEEVFEHLRKGTKLQCRLTSSSPWANYAGELEYTTITDMVNLVWRIKPEPEVIELNGKKYREIVE